MNRLNLIVSGVAVLLLVLAVGFTYAGYNGNDAISTHYMTKGEWSTEVCGVCHYGVYEQVNNSYHVQVDMDRWSPLTNFDLNTSGKDAWVAEFGEDSPGGGPLTEYGMDVDCWICHDQYGLYDYNARAEAIENGDYEDAHTVAIANSTKAAQTGLIQTLTYSANILTPYPLLFFFHGAVNGAPAETSCAEQCHLQDVSTRAVTWGSEETYKEYDAHAENGVECVDCHEVEGYVVASDHQIGRGNVSDTPDLADSHYDDTMKSCDSGGCHVGISHGTFADSHMDFLDCTSCHIPELPGGELLGGKPLKAFSWQNGEREDTYWEEAFRPVLAWYNGTFGDVLPSVDSRNDSNVKLTPFNKITGTWWDAGTDPEIIAAPNNSTSTGDPIPVKYVKAADANGNGEVTVEEMQAYDADGDGQPDYPNAVLRTVDLYYQVSHNIVSTDVGITTPLTCKDCHGNESIIDWEALGYSEDPGGESAAAKGIDVSYERPRPEEVEQEPAF